MDNGKSLYKQLSSDKLYTKSYDEFVKQYGNPEGQKELFNKLSSDDLYTKSEEEFINQYWAPVKKKASLNHQEPLLRFQNLYRHLRNLLRFLRR